MRENERVKAVEAALGRALNEDEKVRASHVLETLTELFTQEAGTAYPPRRFRHLVKVDRGRVFLPFTPLVKVHDLRSERGEEVPYTVAHNHLLVNATNRLTLIVEYTAGWDVIPPLAAAQITDAAARVFRLSPVAATGAQTVQQSGGGYSGSVTFANWAVGGQVMLAPADIKVARSFRPRRRAHAWTVNPA